MDQNSGLLTGYAVSCYQLGRDTYCLDSEGNLFILDVASRQWLQCGQAESVQRDYTALVGSTWNGTMTSSSGINISSTHGGGHPQQDFVRPADTQLRVGGSDLRTERSQSQVGRLPWCVCVKFLFGHLLTYRPYSKAA